MQTYSEYISRKVSQNILRAFDYAKVIGIPLNTYVVINIRETDAVAAATAFQRIRHKYRDWLSRKAKQLGTRLPPKYVFSFEAPTHPHVNWVLRVPPQLQEEFTAKLPKWIAKVQGPLRPFDLRLRELEVGGAYKALANYVIKGCDPAYIDHFHLRAIHQTHGPQGAFWGRRAAVSAALNKTARDARGYDAKRRRLKPLGVPPNTPSINKPEIA